MAKTAPISTPTDPIADVFNEAYALVRGERQKDYGPKAVNFNQIAMYWTAHLAQRLQSGTTITERDVALMMIQVKMARLLTSPNHHDSIVDCTGYAGIYADLIKSSPSDIPPSALLDFALKYF